MAYNALSGTVVANKTVVFKDNDNKGELEFDNAIYGTFYGEGQYLKNVARVVANDINDYVVTLGNQEQSLVGEPNLRFNGNRLYVNAPVTASALQLTSLEAGTAQINSFLAIDSNNNVILTSSGGGSGGSIGAAEDGDYTDGLFIDFTNNTPVGTTVDRFNEILKSLSPSPSPSLDNLGSNNYGATAKLSFGDYNKIDDYENSQTSAGFSSVDVNETYAITSNNGNLRRGVFNGAATIAGILNDNVAEEGVNYPADSFGDADQGHLILEVNGSEIHSVDLSDTTVGSGEPGSGTGVDTNSDSSGFTHLSITASAKFPDGSVLDIFKHRTGRYSINPASQRNGWNYARVLHRINSVDTTTNYIEWVNDDNSVALEAKDGALNNLNMTGDLRLSGVKYHTAGTAQYEVEVNNAYRNVYSTQQITFGVSRVSVAAQDFPAIDYNSGEDENKQLKINAQATINVNSILNSSIGVSVNVPHPLKADLATAEPEVIGGILLYNLSNNSSTTSETFRREDYRLASGSYDAQSDVTDSSNDWDSNDSLEDSQGLAFYNQRLYYPTNSDLPYSGDFTQVTNGPVDNKDYSKLSGTRNFYRAFTNTGASSQTNFQLTFAGDSNTRIVPASTSLSSTNIHVFVKLPTTTNSMETGWLDLAVASASDDTQLNDGDGAYVGTPSTLTVNATHQGTFVTQTVEQNESLMIRLEASSAWTGYLSSVSIVWGNA